MCKTFRTQIRHDTLNGNICDIDLCIDIYATIMYLTIQLIIVAIVFDHKLYEIWDIELFIISKSYIVHFLHFSMYLILLYSLILRMCYIIFADYEKGININALVEVDWNSICVNISKFIEKTHFRKIKFA